jgi:P4 family phage/plasmid primase-like protien
MRTTEVASTDAEFNAGDESSGSDKILAMFTPTGSGGLQGTVLGHTLFVFYKEDEWRFGIELPNGEKRWPGRGGHSDREQAARAALKELKRLRKAADADHEPSVAGGSKRTRRRPGKTQKQLHDELSAKLKSGKSKRKLSIGSDVELAKCVCEDLHKTFGEVVYTEGKLWVWAGTHWVDLPEHLLSRAVHPYDGVWVGEPNQPGSWQIRMSKGKIASVAHVVVGLRTYPDFFADVPEGINCASGFIEFADDGTPTLRPHDRRYRQRHVLPGKWAQGTDGTPPEGSLLKRFLTGIFRGDAEEAEKLKLLQELAGSAATGLATKLRRPKAAMLIGPLAENGKSQYLDLVRGQLPPEAVASITPSKVGHDYHVAGLVGKLLNASDEASSAEAIGSETFKAVVTGDPVHGRPIYERPVEFRPVAQHLFATNVLPSFKGGMDRGVRRRLLVIPFNRVIPTEERVENIGRRIGDEEPDLLLAWAVDGAARLMWQREFTEAAECRLALTSWLLSADAVEAWFEDAVTVVPVYGQDPRIRTREAFAAFRLWALQEGFKDAFIPAIHTFTQKVKARPGVDCRRQAEGAFFYGLSIRQDLLEEAEKRADAAFERNYEAFERARERGQYAALVKG